MNRPNKKAFLVIPLLLILAGGIALHLGRAKANHGDLRFFGNVDIRQVQLSFHDTERPALLWPQYWPMAVIGLFCMILAGRLFRRRMY